MQTNSVRFGITFLVCTYNGVARLPNALRYLAAQVIPLGLPWEVVLVSNASTDDTLAVALRLWAEVGAPAPLRLFEELKPGKENALTKGFDEAAYEAMCVVDDDNWLYPDYAGHVARVMQEHPEIGILGGCAEAAFEVEPPAWFSQFQATYAVGPQAPQPGPMLVPEEYIYGAGSVVRRSAWQHIRANGFEFTTSTRRGEVVVSGEDIELGNVLRLAGYVLWYDPLLRLRHFMFKERLTWQALRRLSEGGSVSVLTDAVYHLLFRHPDLDLAGFRTHYLRAVLWQARAVLQQPRQAWNYAWHHDNPARFDTFGTRWSWGKFRQLLRKRSEMEVAFIRAKALQSRFRASVAPIALKSTGVD